MENKKYAVVFPYQDSLKNVLAYIRSKKRDVWDFAEDDVIEFVGMDEEGEDVMLNVYFLREGIGDFTRFENIMWYTPGTDLPDKVMEWIEEIFYGKQA